MSTCVQVHKDARRWCQAPGAGLTRTKASQQDAENIILVLWKNSKYSSTLSHLSSQTKLLRQNFSHFNGSREAIILVNMKMDLQSTLILWLFNMFFREVKV